MSIGKLARYRVQAGALALVIAGFGSGASPAWAQTNEDMAPPPAAAPAGASATDDPKVIYEREAKNKDVFTFDYGVPSSPALTLLGIDTDKITQSNSLKPFVLSLPGLLTSKESGQSAALEISPAWLIVPASDRTHDKYDAGRAVLFRTRIGFALYEGVDDADPANQKPSRASIGLSTSFLPSSDPLLATVNLPRVGKVGAWETCFNDGLNDILDATRIFKATPEIATLRAERDRLQERNRVLQQQIQAHPSPERLREILAERAGLEGELGTVLTNIAKLEADWQTEARAEFAKSNAPAIIAGCKRVADRAARIGSDLDFGGGAVWNGAPGHLKGLHDPSAVLWASFRTSLGVPQPTKGSYSGLIQWADKTDRWFMIGGSARLGLSEAVATGDAAKPRIKANTFTGWFGLERYTDTSRLAAQIGLQRTDPILASDDGFAGTRTVYLVSYDQQLIEGVWVSASYGKADGAGTLESDSTARISLVFTTPSVRNIFGK